MADEHAPQSGEAHTEEPAAEVTQPETAEVTTVVEEEESGRHIASTISTVAAAVILTAAISITVLSWLGSEGELPPEVIADPATATEESSDVDATPTPTPPSVPVEEPPEEQPDEPAEAEGAGDVSDPAG